MIQDKFIKTNIIGIIINVAIIILKINIGFLINSPTIISDALKNTTSTISSVFDVIGHRIESNPNPQIYNQLSGFSSILISALPLLGAKFAKKDPDKNHPYGYGRVEYIMSILTSIVALSICFISIKEIIIFFIRPSPTHYSYAFLTIISITIIVKTSLGIYFRYAGRNLKIPALFDSAKAELFDAGISFATVISAFLSMKYGIFVDGLLTLIITVFIMKSSLDMMKTNIDKLIGARTSSQLYLEIKNSIQEVPKVEGVFDLNIHDYGSKNHVGTVHILVDKNLTAKEIHSISLTVSTKIYAEFSIILCVGIYADETGDIKDNLYAIASKYENMMEILNVLIDEQEHLILIDIQFPFDADVDKLKNMILDEFKHEYPEFDFFIINSHF